MTYHDRSMESMGHISTLNIIESHGSFSRFTMVYPMIYQFWTKLAAAHDLENLTSSQDTVDGKGVQTTDFGTMEWDGCNSKQHTNVWIALQSRWTMNVWSMGMGMGMDIHPATEYTSACHSTMGNTTGSNLRDEEACWKKHAWNRTKQRWIQKTEETRAET